MGIRLPGFVALVLLAALAFLGSARPSSAQPVVQGTDFTLFWRGDLRIIATRDNTQITITDASTGAVMSPTAYTSNLGVGGTNPFELRTAGDSFEANNGTLTYRIHVSATRSRGPAEEKPIIIWTGTMESQLMHPASPPSAWANSWVSNVRSRMALR